MGPVVLLGVPHLDSAGGRSAISRAASAAECPRNWEQVDSAAVDKTSARCTALSPALYNQEPNPAGPIAALKGPALRGLWLPIHRKDHHLGPCSNL